MLDGTLELESLPPEELEALGEAAREITLCTRVLAKTGDTIVGEILRDAGPVREWCHYPSTDVYDAEYHAQYYYHVHPPAERAEGEHGHFHTFLRPLGMPVGIRPLPLPDLAPDKDGNEALSHLIGISMDKSGRPTRLFTTNRWVTGETWYAAEDVIRMLDHFIVDHARPSWPVNRWITAVVRIYRPVILGLLHRRDERIVTWKAQHPDENVYEDRRLEVTSEVDISLEEHVQRVELALRRQRRRLREAAGLSDGARMTN